MLTPRVNSSTPFLQLWHSASEQASQLWWLLDSSYGSPISRALVTVAPSSVSGWYGRGKSTGRLWYPWDGRCSSQGRLHRTARGISYDRCRSVVCHGFLEGPALCDVREKCTLDNTRSVIEWPSITSNLLSGPRYKSLLLCQLLLGV
jgi:hypothetical protein